MRITHDEWERFFQLHGAMADAEKQMKPLKEKIKAFCLEGGQSPKDLPYKAVIREQGRTLSDWRGACARVLFRMFKSQPKVEAELVKIEASFDKQPVQNLVVEINHSYAAKVS